MPFYKCPSKGIDICELLFNLERKFRFSTFALNSWFRYTLCSSSSYNSMSSKFSSKSTFSFHSSKASCCSGASYSSPNFLIVSSVSTLYFSSFWNCFACDPLPTYIDSKLFLLQLKLLAIYGSNIEAYNLKNVYILISFKTFSKPFWIFRILISWTSLLLIILGCFLIVIFYFLFHHLLFSFHWCLLCIH